MVLVFMEFMVKNQNLKFKAFLFGEVLESHRRLRNYQIMNITLGTSLTTLMLNTEDYWKNFGSIWKRTRFAMA